MPIQGVVGGGVAGVVGAGDSIPCCGGVAGDADGVPVTGVGRCSSGDGTAAGDPVTGIGSDCKGAGTVVAAGFCAGM